MAESSIDKLTLDIVVNNNNAVRRINAITKSVEKLNSVLKNSSIDKTIDKINDVSPKGKSNSTKKDTSKSGVFKNLSIFATLGRLNYYTNMARYYGRQLAQIVQYAIDYNETLNLWQVANRENLYLANEFINKMQKAYGLSKQSLMNYQAIFKNMLSSLGNLSDIASSALSQSLTQMALDFASLYNVSISSAMQKFQAVLSGQVRPIRSVSGYDITENTIYDLYQKMGGEKTMRQLSQLEKRLLRIVAVFDQMQKTGAINDMGKTIESAANQARIMGEQLKECLTWTGQMLLQWLNQMGVFQRINAALMVMTEIMKSLAIESGYQAENWTKTVLDNVEETDETIDDIQGKLLSFDKFIALNSASQTSLIDIDPRIEEAIKNIKLDSSNIEMEARKISEQWMKQIGLGEEIYRIQYANGEIVEKTAEEYANMTEEQKAQVVNVEVYRKMNEQLRNHINGLKVVGIALTGILGTMIAIKVVSFAMSNWVSIVAGLAVALAYVIASNWQSIEKFFKSIGDWFANLWNKIVDGFMAAINTIKATMMAFVAMIKAAFETILKPFETIKRTLRGRSVSMNSSIPAYATGGFPEDGMFFANSGEMVGQFSNGKTAVANNDQIVTGITQGVYNAMMAYNAQTHGNNGSGDVYLDGTKVGKLVARSSHREMVRTGLVSKSS